MGVFLGSGWPGKRKGVWLGKVMTCVLDIIVLKGSGHHPKRCGAGAPQRGRGHQTSSSPAGCSSHTVLSLQDGASQAYYHLRASGFLHNWSLSFFSSQLCEAGA